MPRGAAVFPELLLIFVVSTILAMLGLFVFHFFPITAVIAPVVWVIFLYADVASTWVLYVRAPKRFRQTERSVYLKRLLQRFEFRPAILLAVGIELLLLLPVSLIIAYLIGDFFFRAIDIPASVATGLIIFGAAHLHAWARNKRR